MQTMPTMNDRLRGLNVADIALPAGLPAMFLLGWILATSVRHDQEYSHIYFGAAFILFAASYVAAYSWSSTIRTRITYGLTTPANMWLYKGLAYLQAFTAGMVLNIYRLTAVIPYHWDRAGAGHLYSLLFATMIIISISTWLFTCVRPKSVIAIMPIAIFTVGTVMSYLMSEESAAFHDASAMSVFEAFDAGSVSFLNIVLYLSGGALKYSTYLALGIGTLYAIIRPFWSRSYQGYEHSCAMNGYIAAVIVMLPCFLKTSFCNVPSVVHGIRWEPLSFYSVIVWSWMIGNFIVHVPYLWDKLKPSAAAYPGGQRKDKSRPGIHL